MAKETFYFSHDSNALTDTKILNMRADYGLEGYGLYWAIIEMLRNEEDYKLEFNKNTYRAIKTLTNTTIDVEKFINNCIEDYKLFELQEEKFYSNSLLRRMEAKDKKSTVAREKAQKRWNNDTSAMQQECNSNAVAMQQQCSSNANKIKENKIKENKVNENKAEENKEKEIKEKNLAVVADDEPQRVINDEDVKKITKFWNENIGLITPFELQTILGYLHDMSVDLIILAIKKAVSAKVKTLNYIEGILRNWQRNNIKTVLEAEQETEKFKNEKENKEVSNKQEQSKKHNYSNYEQRDYSDSDFNKLYANKGE